MSGRNSNTASARKAKDDWRTPKWLWDILNAQYKFEIDCAASKDNHLCPMWNGKEGSGTSLMFRVKETVGWINPPFSNPWMLQRFWIELHKRVGIYRCDNMETKVWQDLILPTSDWVFFIHGRVNYEGHEGKGAMFGSALFASGVEPPVGIAGTLLKT